MSDKVERWLEEIGLPQYADLFRRHHLDWELLPALDADTLREIGVASAGHRLRILGAAKSLDSPPRVSDSPLRGGDAPRAHDVPDEAERRQVTVLFSDLVGSTALSQALDPEDLREVMRAYQDACTAAIERFDGFVARYMGDGVLAYFGYPRAHEDAAERAVLAALAVLEAIEALDVSAGGPSRIELAARVGIATGSVVAGDLIGQGASQERTVVGETPNLAARLQGVAQPGTVAVAPETRALCASSFVFDDLGVHELKGIERPVQVWRAVASRTVPSRFDTRSVAGLTRFHGREEEIALVLDSWRSARAGDGRIVMVSGEPGIGKSRIAQAFRADIAGEDHATFRFQCSPHHVDSAFYPFVAQIRIAAGIAPGDANTQQVEKLSRLLGERGPVDRSVLATIASLLSIPAMPGLELPALSPPALKELTLKALLEQLLSITRTLPVVIELEDAHWIDPSTLELMSMVVERLHELPVLLIVTHRPEFACPWTGHPGAASIVLDHLAPDESAAIIDELCGGRALPGEVLAQILEKTDGVPLFVEELTKNVLESGMLVASAERLVLADALAPLAIPASLQDSLMARLDRLGPEKRLAQVGAAIGREFPRDLLAAAAGLDGDALDAALDELVDSGLVLRRDKADAVSYQFKHALVQDAAYASLVRRSRQSLHLRLATVYSERFADVADAQPEVLARHWSEGGKPREAALCRLAAGQRASRLFSNEEALSHLESGLALLDQLAEGRARDELELKLRVALGTVLRVRAGPGADVTQDNYNQAVALCDRLPESAEHFAAMWGKWVNAMNFKLELGLQWTDRLQGLAHKLDDPGFRLQAHHAQWTTLFHVGRFADACEHTEQGLGYYDESAHRHHAVLYGGHDPRVCGRAFAAHALWMLGAFDRSLDSARACADWGGALDHVGSRLHVIEAHLLLYQFRREPENLVPWLDSLEAICRDEDLPEYRGKLVFNRGWLAASRGDVARGIGMMRDGLSNQRSVGSYEDIPMFSERLAESLAAAGQAQAGLELLDEALSLADAYSFRYWLAELHRRKGLLLAQVGDVAGGGDSLRRALDVACRQGAKTLELRARASVALCAPRGADADASMTELGRLLDSFTEGLDCVDLVETRALVDATG